MPFLEIYALVACATGMFFAVGLFIHSLTLFGPAGEARHFVSHCVRAARVALLAGAVWPVTFIAAITFHVYAVGEEIHRQGGDSQ